MVTYIPSVAFKAAAAAFLSLKTAKPKHGVLFVIHTSFRAPYPEKTFSKSDFLTSSPMSAMCNLYPSISLLRLLERDLYYNTKFNTLSNFKDYLIYLEMLDLLRLLLFLLVLLFEGLLLLLFLGEADSRSVSRIFSESDETIVEKFMYKNKHQNTKQKSNTNLIIELLEVTANQMVFKINNCTLELYFPEKKVYIRLKYQIYVTQLEKY